MKASAPVAAVFCLVLAAAALQAAPQASRSDARTGGLAYELLHASRITYNTAQMSVNLESSREELMLRRLFGVYAGSRIFFDLVEDHETSRRRIEDTLLVLRSLADEAETAVQRAQAYHSVRRSWEDTRAALSLLLQHYGVVAERRTLPPGTGEEPEPREEVEPEPKNARVRISGTDWLGGFTPDLEVRGVFEGLRLTRAVLEVYSGDKVVYKDEETLTGQIAKAGENWPKHLEMRVDWRKRIDDDQLASGDNRIVITLENARGEKATAETTIRKRLF